jgi:AcrR family transcriptional regulator
MTAAAATVDRVVIATALLWCRHGTLPTARQIGATARLAPRTVTGAFGDIDGLYDAVAERELAKVKACLLALRAPCEALAEHALVLHSFDRTLVRWPALALTRASGAGADLAWLTPAAVAAIHTIGALVARPHVTIDDALACLRHLGWVGAIRQTA